LDPTIKADGRGDGLGVHAMGLVEQGSDMNVHSCDNAFMSHGTNTDLAFVSAQTARSVAETMQALATPSRVRILSRLSAGPCSVGELADQIEMEQSAVSQQLRVLRHLGLVVGERDGRHVIYALHDDHVRALLTEAVSHTDHLRLGLSSAPATEGLTA
jgi:DNA-binding transcriptional ArsR family regulator